MRANTVVYRWPDRTGYLLDAVYPEGESIPADPRDNAESVMPRLPVSAGHFVFHLDCTVTNLFPARRQRLVRALTQQGVRVSNAGVTDVSKRALQIANRKLGLPSVAALFDGAPNEPIIIKTNYNYAGECERRLSEAERARLGWMPLSSAITRPKKYVVTTRRQIPVPVWLDQTLVLERFVENPEGLWYRAYVSRPKVALCGFRCRKKLKKVGDSTLESFVALDTAAEGCPTNPISDLAIRFVNGFGLDFGAVDIVTDGKDFHAVIDVNPTPFFRCQFPEVLACLRDSEEQEAAQ